MFILRLLLVVILVVVVGSLVMGYLGGRAAETVNQPVVAEPSKTIERARDRGAELGEKAAVAATKVEATLEEAALTAKIKAKMALDDSVKARAIDVTTRGTTVTLSGTVQSKAEEDRAIALARETQSVTQVIDDLHTR
jgi:hyperosmotically inducible periplasmic protein